eukprot:876786-Rhodomonas_salina.3
MLKAHTLWQEAREREPALVPATSGFSQRNGTAPDKDEEEDSDSEIDLSDQSDHPRCASPFRHRKLNKTCHGKQIETPRTRRGWSKEEDAHLREAVRRHGARRAADVADDIAAEFGDRTTCAVTHRIQRLKLRPASPAPTLSSESESGSPDGGFEDSESESKNETSDQSDRSCSKPSSSSTSCDSERCGSRQTGKSMLRWSEEEDVRLRRAVRRHGRSRMAEIAAEFQERTYSAVKHRLQRLELVPTTADQQFSSKAFGEHVEEIDASGAGWETEGCGYLARPVRFQRGSEHVDGVVVGWRPALTSSAINPETGRLTTPWLAARPSGSDVSIVWQGFDRRCGVFGSANTTPEHSLSRSSSSCSSGISFQACSHTPSRHSARVSRLASQCGRSGKR